MELFKWKMQRICIFQYALLFFISLQYVQNVSAISVMSIDFGSEWMKVAIVSPGVPMEIALNKESKRKTPVAIAFRDGERTFGDDALTVGVRFPQSCYLYLTDLLGKTVDNPIVELYKKRFPYYDIVPDSERNTVVFKHSSDVFYSVEELVGMMLHKAKEMAEIAAGNQPVNDAVIVVPGYFNQAERKAMMQAAELAGLNVLQLINDYTAVALNYGIFRRKDFNDTAQYIMLYDMGAASTTATVVSYQVVKSKERGFVETNPQLSILGVGYDRTLGGLEIQLRLQNFLAKKFDEMKKTPNSVFKNPRGMAKLFKEAGRLKNILSANADHYAQVEGLLDDHDFRLQITRDELESLCKDLLDRVQNPIKQALSSSSLTMDVISQVILVGAGTRMPAVQDKLISGMPSGANKELGKSLNTDEAAVMGAAYKGADLSKGFKVKKFITRDAVVFPIQVTFEREGDSGATKVVRRTLFGLMNPYPQKKIITFHKHLDDFTFDVGYNDLNHLQPLELDAIGSLILSKVSLSGVGEAIKKHQGEGVDYKGVKAHFSMDESGLLSLVSVEVVFEKTVDPSSDGGESTLSKLGETLSSFFGGSSPAPPAVADDDAPASNGTDSSGSNNTASGNGEEDGKQADGNSSQNKTDNDDTSSGNASEKVPTGEQQKVKLEKPKLVVVKEDISVKVQNLTVQAMTDKLLSNSIKKLGELNDYDEAKSRREGALNSLESFVFEAKNKLDTVEYKSAATPTEGELIISLANKLGNWVEEEGWEAETSILEGKLKELHQATEAVWLRVKEHRDRPDALLALQTALNGSQTFLVGAKNVTSTQAAAGADSSDAMFTKVEIETLERTIKDISDWREKALVEQNAMPAYENPRLTVKLIVEKIGVLDREVKYLMNKAKIWRPKNPPPVKEPSSSSTDGSSDKSSSSKTADDKVIKGAKKENDNVTAEETPEIPSPRGESSTENSTQAGTEEALHTEL